MQRTIPEDVYERYFDERYAAVNVVNHPYAQYHRGHASTTKVKTDNAIQYTPGLESLFDPDSAQLWGESSSDHAGLWPTPAITGRDLESKLWGEQSSTLW